MTPTVIDVPAPREPMVLVLGQAPEPVRREPPRTGPRHARPRAGSTWLDHVLSLLAVLGVVCVGVTIAATQLGLKPMVVKSGSMEPTIATGSMVLTRTIPASAIRVGDVVSVKRPDRTTVTHRVVTVTHNGTTATLVLKGDANTDPDPAPVMVSSAGRLVATLPVLGRVGAFLSSARGGFVLGWVVAGVMLSVVRRKSG